MTTIALQNTDVILSGETLELRLSEARTLRFPITDRSTRLPTAENLTGASATARIYDQANNLIADIVGTVDATNKLATATIPGNAIVAPGGYALELRVLLASGALLRFPHGELVRVRVRELYASGEAPAGVPAVPPGVATSADLAAAVAALTEMIEAIPGGGGGGGGADPYESEPPAIGTGTAGTVEEYSKGNHTHDSPADMATDDDLIALAAATDTALAGKAPTGHTHSSGQVSGLATVATSGAYADLSGKPVAATISAEGLQSAADKTLFDQLVFGFDDVATAKVADWTFVLTDRRKLIPYSHASAKGTFSIPPGSGGGAVAYPNGTLLGAYQVDVGELWIVPGAGVTVEAMGRTFATGEPMVCQGKGMAPVVFVKLSTNAWRVISGDLMPLPYGFTTNASKYLRPAANPSGVTLSTAFHARGAIRANAPVQSNNYVCGRSNSTNAGWWILANAGSGTPGGLFARVWNGSGTPISSTTYTMAQGDLGRLITWLMVINGTVLSFYVNGVLLSGSPALTTVTDFSSFTALGCDGNSAIAPGNTIVDNFGLGIGLWAPSAAQGLQWHRDVIDGRSLDVAMGGGTDSRRWVIDPDGQTATEKMGSGEHMAINSAGAGLQGSSRKPRLM